MMMDRFAHFRDEPAPEVEQAEPNAETRVYRSKTVLNRKKKPEPPVSKPHQQTQKVVVKEEERLFELVHGDQPAPELHLVEDASEMNS